MNNVLDFEYTVIQLDRKQKRRNQNMSEETTPKILYLIDGYAQIFRAYYAIRTAMISPETSEPTNAVFGFTGMLFKLLNQFQPYYVAVAIDVPGRTFRDDLYAQYLNLHPANARIPDNFVTSPILPTGGEETADMSVEGPKGRYVEYKGTRQSIPDDFHPQVHRIFEVIESFGIPIVGRVGVEADDVIATIVQQILDDPKYADVHIRIIAKDKDLEQLLCERVSIFDVHTDTIRDVAELQASKGITPEQVVDVMALSGDTVDNIPGVEGIGVKTAAALVRQYGDIEGILAHIHEIKGKRRENLEIARDFLPLSKAMVTLKRDAELPVSLDSLLRVARVAPIDLEKMLALFQQLGFNRYQEAARRMALAAGDA